MVVNGFAVDGYERVRVIFERLVADGRETGAAVSIWRDGKEVVSLTGGWRDASQAIPWTADTLVHTYSTSKPFAALTALLLVADGALELDEPVRTWWPEYAQHGKEETTLRHILSHQAGLPRFPAEAKGIDLLNEEALRGALQSSPPEFEPGTQVAEHALTYGHLIDGAVRASTGQSLGKTYASRVKPALEVDAWFGVPADQHYRVADIEHALPGGATQFITDTAPTYDEVLALPAGTLDPERLNSAGWRHGVFAAINLHASASGLAGFYARLLSPDGPVRQLLGAELHEEYVRTQVCGYDATVGLTVNWTLGFLRSASFIGLGGLGGSAAYWSYRNDHAVAYVTRRLHDHSRVAEIAIDLGDDINMQITCD